MRGNINRNNLNSPGSFPTNIGRHVSFAPPSGPVDFRVVQRCHVYVMVGTKVTNLFILPVSAIYQVALRWRFMFHLTSDPPFLRWRFPWHHVLKVLFLQTSQMALLNPLLCSCPACCGVTISGLQKRKFRSPAILHHGGLFSIVVHLAKLSKKIIAWTVAAAPFSHDSSDITRGKGSGNEISLSSASHLSLVTPSSGCLEINFDAMFSQAWQT